MVVEKLIGAVIVLVAYVGSFVITTYAATKIVKYAWFN